MITKNELNIIISEWTKKNNRTPAIDDFINDYSLPSIYSLTKSICDSLVTEIINKKSFKKRKKKKYIKSEIVELIANWKKKHKRNLAKKDFDNDEGLPSAYMLQKTFNCRWSEAKKMIEEL